MYINMCIVTYTVDTYLGTANRSMPLIGQIRTVLSAEAEAKKHWSGDTASCVIPRLCSCRHVTRVFSLGRHRRREAEVSYAASPPPSG